MPTDSPIAADALSPRLARPAREVAEASAAPATGVPDGLPTPLRYAAMAAVVLGIMLSVLDSTIVNLALPSIARQLHASPAQSVWLISAYQIAIVTTLLPLAMLGDLVGYRKVYLAGVTLFTLASLGCALAGSFEMLVAARALQGLGAAGIMALNSALVRLIYPRRLLGRGVALNSVVVATGSVAGPSIAAAILSVGHWPWLFVVNLPVGVAVLALGGRALPTNPSQAPPGSRLSPLDVALNLLTFGLVFLGGHLLGGDVSSEGGAGGGGAQVGAGLALLATGALSGVVYVRRQAALRVPMLPLDLLRIPVFALSMCTSVAAFAAQMLAYVSLPFLLIGAHGRSITAAGLLITAWPLGVVVVAPLAGHLIGRRPDGLLAGVGLAVLGLGTLLAALLPAQASNADIAWRLAICGLGFGLFQSPNNHAIVTAAPQNRSGAASGLLGTARLTGQTLGAVVLAGLFGALDVHGGLASRAALAAAAACAGIASAFSLLRMRGTAPR